MTDEKTQRDRPVMLNPTEILSHENAAAILGMSGSALYQAVSAGIIRPYKFNGRNYYRKSELEALVFSPSNLSRSQISPEARRIAAKAERRAPSP